MKPPKTEVQEPPNPAANNASGCSTDLHLSLPHGPHLLSFQALFLKQSHSPNLAYIIPGGISLKDKSERVSFTSAAGHVFVGCLNCWVIDSFVQSSVGHLPRGVSNPPGQMGFWEETKRRERRNCSKKFWKTCTQLVGGQKRNEVRV
jgi:hypothetical protein